MTCCGLSLNSPLLGSRFECLCPSWWLYSGDCVTFGRWHTPVWGVDHKRQALEGYQRALIPNSCMFLSSPCKKSASWLSHHNGQALSRLPHCNGDGLLFPRNCRSAGEPLRGSLWYSVAVSHWYRSYLPSWIFYKYRGLWRIDVTDNQSRTQVEGVSTAEAMKIFSF